MGLNKPTQKLRHDLKQVAFNLERAGIDLCRLTQRIDGADGLAAMLLVSKLYEDADTLLVYASEVKAGGIVRAEPGWDFWLEA